MSDAELLLSSKPNKIIITVHPDAGCIRNIADSDSIGHPLLLLGIAGTGTLHIDWGDGTPYATHFLSPYYEGIDSCNDWRYKYYRNFPDSVHTIIIACDIITHFRSMYNGLTDLDVSGCSSLVELVCGGNQLTELDISKNIALTKLYCRDNQLTRLDVSKNTALTVLSCQDNLLTELDISRCCSLIKLNCERNKLTSRNISHNTILMELRRPPSACLDESNQEEFHWAENQTEDEECPF